MPGQVQSWAADWACDEYRDAVVPIQFHTPGRLASARELLGLAAGFGLGPGRLLPFSGDKPAASLDPRCLVVPMAPARFSIGADPPELADLGNVGRCTVQLADGGRV